MPLCLCNLEVGLALNFFKNGVGFMLTPIVAKPKPHVGLLEAVHAAIEGLQIPTAFNRIYFALIRDTLQAVPDQYGSVHYQQQERS